MKFNEIFDSASYVGATNKDVYPYIRKEFFIKNKIKKAELTISILGFGEIYLNGKKVNKDLYVSTYSQYNKQTISDVDIAFKNDYFFKEEHDYSIYVTKYNLTDYVVNGKNVLGLVLSGGWYKGGNDKYGNYRHYGDISACFKIDLTTESDEIIRIVSDGDCKWRKNFLIDGGIFFENQNENDEVKNFSFIDYDDSEWGNAVCIKTPNAEYLDDEYPRQIIEKYIKPTLIKQGDNYKIYDVGVNTTGYPIIKTENKKNMILECVYSEEKTDDNELDKKYIFAQKSTFITDGRKEHNIRFTWHGFRYFKVFVSENIEFYCDSVAVVHSDVKNTSKFTCNDDVVQWLYESYINSQTTNYQCGVPTDCPHIERQGYTGDGQLLSELGMMLFDSKLLYKKWLRDISDGQDKISGNVSYTAPNFMSSGGGVGGWGIAIVNVPFNYYKVCGDMEILKEFYPKMIKYIDFLKAHSENGLVVSAQPNAWNLGEWCTPDEVKISPTFVNSCFYLIALLRMQEICSIIGNEQDISMLKERYEIVSNAIKRDFYDENTGDFCDNVQGANAFAIVAGIAEEKTVSRLIEFYRQEKAFNVGIFGLDFVSEVLLKNGQGDLFIEMINADKEGCFLEWKKNGATSLYEDWNNARSHNHPMFGSIVKYFYKYILGIKQCKNSNSYNEIEISPLYFKNITKASGEIKTESGVISVAFNRENDKTEFIIDIPVGIKATFNFYGEYKTLLNGINKFFI